MLYSARSRRSFFLYPPRGKGFNVPMSTPSLPSSPALPANDSFEDLLLAVGKKRDRDAFVRLFNHFAPRIKSFLMKGGASPSQAEELVQETMLTIWTRAAGYDPAKAGASTWIFTIARNKRIDSLRRTRRIEVDVNDAAYVSDENATSPDQGMIDSDRTEKIADVLKILPQEQADLIHKAFFEDKTHMQIATETGLPLGTVKSRIRLAMDRLRPSLQKDAL